MTTRNKITNCQKNNMGTVSFDGQFTGMRKAQDFIVYPMQDAGTVIRIQSDKRFGALDIETGRGILSASRAQYANSVWLQMSVANKTAVAIELPAEELQTLRGWIKSTGGLLVGESFIKCENLGALSI